MFIPQIFRPSEISKPKARGWRSPSRHCFQLEPLEIRTALSGGLNIGFAEALISNRGQFAVADFSVAPPINSTTQEASAVSSQTFVLLGGPFEGGVPSMPPAATGDFLPHSPVDLQQVVPTAVDAQSSAGAFSLSQPPAALALVTGSPGFGSGAQVENDLPLPAYTAVVTIDLGMRPFDVPDSSVSRPNGPELDDIPEHLYDFGNPYMRGFIMMDMMDFDPSDMNPPPPPPYAAKQPLSQIDLNAISDPDVNVLGSLISADSHESSSALMMMTESAAGRASGSGFGSISTGPSTQMDLSMDSSGNGWMSYVATGGWVASDVQAPVFRGDVVPALDETATEPSTAASITAGEVPLSVLLSGPDAPVQTGSDRVEQVAELIPLEESSLALVATLWTVSSDSQTSPPQGDVEPAGGGMDPHAPLASPPSWTAFIIGLNEAFEQSQRDVEQGFFSSPRRPTEGARGRGALDEVLPWQGPIVPAAERGSFEKVRGGSRTGSPAPPDEATRLRTGNDARPCHAARVEAASSQSGEGQTVAVASLPAISAVSALGLIAGWFWTQRERLARFRPERNGWRSR
jgi:hypothetical protein